MLTSVLLENFFSFGEQTIKVNSNTNILVGINGTGKSNFIKALQFLYETVSGEKTYLEIFEEWGGVSEVLNKNIGKKTSISLSFEFDKNWLPQLFGSIDFGVFKFPGSVTLTFDFDIYDEKISFVGEYIGSKLDEQKYIWYQKTHNDFFRFVHIRSAPFTEKAGIVDYVEEFVDEQPVLAQITERDRERFAPLYTLKQAILQMAVYYHFDISRESKIRALSKIYAQKKLLSNGENLVHLLNTLSTKQLVAYEKIEEHLSKINPNFKSLTFSVPMGNQILMSLREKNMQHVIPINQMSNGTLQYLLLLAILFNPDRGKLICIDELETGLHPDMIKTICDLIKLAMKDGTQFFIATHSPLVLNNFELEDLIIFEKDENNQTYAVKKTEEDFPEWEGEFLAGQMWLRGQLGGKRW